MRYSQQPNGENETTKNRSFSANKKIFQFLLINQIQTYAHFVEIIILQFGAYELSKKKV